MQTEYIILACSMDNEDFLRKTLPYIKKDYFDNIEEKTVFTIIQKHFLKYNTKPTVSLIDYEITKLQNINEGIFNSCVMLMDELRTIKTSEFETEWLINEAELFCKDRALKNALSESIDIFSDDKKNSLSRTSIPELLRVALSVSFDNNLGHDYFRDMDKQYEYYTTPAKKITFSHNCLNEITNGGLEHQTLNLVVAPTHGGKSLIMCDWAAGFVKQGYNVLYITLEMSEETTRKRIDANLLETGMKDLSFLDKLFYTNKVKNLKKKYMGNLKIKGFPAKSISVIDIRRLLLDYEQKENFKPTIVVIDYIGLMKSSIIPYMTNTNTYYQSISEELRGLAQEKDLCMISAAQLNRTGSKSSDPNETDLADSYGLMFTADFAVIILNSEELKEDKQFMFKQVKNRYHDLDFRNKFIMGIDKQLMSIYDIDNNNIPQATKDKMDEHEAAIFDKTTFGENVVPFKNSFSEEWDNV